MNRPLLELEQMAMVTIDKERGGTVVTDKGKRILAMN